MSSSVATEPVTLVRAFTDRVSPSPATASSRCVTFDNGYYDITTDRFHEGEAVHDGVLTTVRAPFLPEAPTPLFDSIVDAQSLNSEVKRVLLALLGRCLHGGGRQALPLEDWRVAPVLVGGPGSGAGTLARVLLGFFDDRDVAGDLTMTTSPGRETKLWTTGLLGDAGDVSPPAPELLAKLICGSEGLSARGIIVLQAMEPSWRESQELREALVCFRFDATVFEPGDDAELLLQRIHRQEMGGILGQINRAYLDLAFVYGAESLWNITSVDQQLRM